MEGGWSDLPGNEVCGVDGQQLAGDLGVFAQVALARFRVLLEQDLRDLYTSS